ncbi:MAG: hypothetical protein LBT98_00815 [Puniceicoccales bacterium]|jgi:hypothetical protein|nr:hypothetical protein [Puniceicoccales bacterium]
MARSIHVVLKPRVHSALLKDAERRGISISKAVQRAVVIALGISDVPVFTAEDLQKKAEDGAPGAFLPGEKMLFGRKDIDGDREIASRFYESASEAIGDLRRETGVDA